MPEDVKKNQQKGKNEPRDQRKRRGRQHAAPVEKKVEKEPVAPKVTAPEKPVYEPPPPEFYTSLKRETDEILKITEEANTKYKKKEIQSNWAKYEMPIETYEEIDEQENLGADYEALIQAPLSVGGHFQFKHEKSWDITTGPSPYDKYFDINMDTLTVALSTIPFYERNSIDPSCFNESDIQSMVHRATKFKNKYYNDKKFTTPDMEVQDKITNILKSNDNENSIELSESDKKVSIVDKSAKTQNQFKDIELENCDKKPMQIACNELTTEDKEAKDLDYIEPSNVPTDTVSEDLSKPDIDLYKQTIDTNMVVEKTEIFAKEKTSSISIETKKNDTNKNINNIIIKEDEFDDFVQNEVVINKNKLKEEEPIIKKKPEVQSKPFDTVPMEKESPKEPAQNVATKNPVIESPEDLEKWLDDFLDG